jgi:uncharacterized protein (UPF0332 family)
VSVHLTRAQEALDDAHLLLERGRVSGAASRAYYAAFHAARAAIDAVASIDPMQIKTHAGIRRMFDLHVVRAGLIDRSTATLLKDVNSTRIRADYAMGALDSPDAAEAVRAAGAFVAACGAIVEQHGS